MSLGDEKYLALTTFKRDGTPVTTTVWSTAIEGDTVGFWTSSGSGKAKRLAHTSKVIVQPSDSRGRPKKGTAPIDATAVLVTGPQLEGIRSRIKAKYGWQCKATKFLNQVGGIVKRNRIPYADRGVLINPN
jgi:uncharacterized protein